MLDHFRDQRRDPEHLARQCRRDDASRREKHRGRCSGGMAKDADRRPRLNQGRPMRRQQPAALLHVQVKGAGHVEQRPVFDDAAIGNAKGAVLRDVDHIAGGGDVAKLVGFTPIVDHA
nr:hypothetical protein [Rugamonas rivuli]